ncbi:uncharacterized protein LOC132601733 [Lycium barbarum]|uniref:uncharacterized protein LOC132601733 n=1 Tax=Lycium barbarum TaxID=112863 RepID=UPI00293E4E0A|nr:uncharacterized protein LOC132601733 [Lycium barbarum]
MRLDPSQRDPNLFCDYHTTHRHQTSDCCHLRDEVALLLKDGHLREFLSDRDTGTPFSTKKDKLSKAHDRRSQGLIQEDVTTFTNEEAKALISPHFDTLVISVMINHCRIDNVVVDPGSSADVIQWGVIEQLEMMGKLTPSVKVFSEASKTAKREIVLSVNAGGVIKNMRFYVVNGDTKCNAIFGRPWIHDMKATTSTLLKQIEFPMSDGIGCTRAMIGGKRNIRLQDCYEK